MLGAKHSSPAGGTALLLGLMAAPLFGAGPGADKKNWDNLKQLAPREQIQIVLNDFRAYRGEFQSVSDEAVVVRVATGEQTFPRPDILRVSAKSKGRGHRNTWIGAGVGAGLGIVAVAMDCRNDRRGCSPEGVALGVPFGAGVGALVGALVPSGGWHDVYRAR
jgi:hypothetical protein